MSIYTLTGWMWVRGGSYLQGLQRHGSTLLRGQQRSSLLAAQIIARNHRR